MSMTKRSSFIRRVARYHFPPLALVLGCAALGQAATFAQHPLIYFAGDSQSYLDAAHRMAWQHGYFQSLRTPGYPALVALVLSLAGWQHFDALVGAQVGLMTLASMELYVLAHRLLHHRWSACASTSLISLNLYTLNWERAILTETLAYWSVVTLFLSFERLMHDPTWWRVIIFGGLSIVAILIRPIFLALPIMLISIFVVRGLHLGMVRRHLLHSVLALLLAYGGVLGYMGVLARTEGYFGLTWVTNINAFGKVFGISPAKGHRLLHAIARCKRA